MGLLHVEDDGAGETLGAGSCGGPVTLRAGSRHTARSAVAWATDGACCATIRKGITQLFDRSHLAATLFLWTQLPDGEGIGRERLHLGTDALGLIKAEFIYTQGPNQLYNLLHACWR